ncbi:MAG: 16S rRNA (cytidine(1402)-2'-O)-methyltransferase [Clostridiales bacterium]|jgi:16S rRNA (cytidine1402-2'-O)-methyltransferase|nr:16S rRNA (cytidine(1402)-2'-O)-methyltransferase [Clostridiales bacterium]
MLYICATPIGNLGDITFRAIECLKTVDIIACEDTRHTKKLLDSYDIKAKTTSYHQHNYVAKGDKLIEMLKNGAEVALVSDAGMPGISDPGEHLVKLCIQNNIEFTILPGASAVTTALVRSGISTNGFIFIGFLPVKKGEAVGVINSVKGNPQTLVFYEAPHRILRTLGLLEQTLGDRQCCVSRELTKKFEEDVRGKISEVLEHFNQHEPRGEFVIVLEGAGAGAGAMLGSGLVEGDIDYSAEVERLINSGMKKSEAVKEVSAIYGIKKQDLYKRIKD